MPFKTILSIVGVNQDDSDLNAAVEICRTADAHLSVLVVGLASPPPVGGYGEIVSAAWLEEREGDMAKLGDRTAAIKTALGPQGISFDVQNIFAEYVWAAETIGERARYADLTLVGGRAMSDEDLRKRAVEGALFESPTPVLFAPIGRAATLQPETVLVAWNSRMEAGRALRASMELLVGAKAVHIAIVDPDASASENVEEPGADIATYLARQDVKVTIDVLAGGGRDAADILRKHAVDIGADLIVMGAYGHSRMRERIFGGVTQSMLEDPRLPVFMAR